jgi:hypothetical protein
MAPETLTDMVDLLFRSMDDASMSTLDVLSMDTEGSSEWLMPFLRRVAVVTFDAGDIPYIRFTLNEVADTHARGQVVVITSRVVAVASFSADRSTFVPMGQVRAWDRAKIEHIEVESADAAYDTDSSDRRRQGSASFTVHLSGGESVQVPPRVEGRRVWEPEALYVLPTLLGSLGS